MIEKKCIKENIHNLFADNLTLANKKKIVQYSVSFCI